MKEEKLTGRGKAKLVIRYLRPVVWLFALGLLMSFFSQIFNAFIPQIVRVTVDSILGTEEPQLPALIAGVLPLEALRADPAAALLWAAGAVVCYAASPSSGSASSSPRVLRASSRAYATSSIPTSSACPSPGTPHTRPAR